MRPSERRRNSRRIECCVRLSGTLRGEIGRLASPVRWPPAFGTPRRRAVWARRDPRRFGAEFVDHETNESANLGRDVDAWRPNDEPFLLQPEIGEQAREPPRLDAGRHEEGWQLGYPRTQRRGQGACKPVGFVPATVDLRLTGRE
jgi:hypothetical protein